MEYPKKDVLLIGPQPPPWHGTSVKFHVFSEFAKKALGENRVDVIDTHTGDKALVAVFGWSSLRGYARIILNTVRYICRSDVILVFGSQRFATVFGMIASVMSKLVGKRFFVSIFGGAYDVYLEGLPAPARKVVEVLFGLSDGIVVETRHLESVLSQVWPGKIHYVPNFRERSPEKAERTVRDNKIRFLYVGVVRREKGTGELLEAFEKLELSLKREAPDLEIELDLVGPVYDNENDYVDLAKAATLPNVRFHGKIPHEQVLDMYAQADVFVYPSYWPTEGHSGAVIEALMHGLPIIAADWRATRELVKEDINGLLCPPKDADAFAACMERMARDAALRQRLAQGARASVDEFSAECACVSMLDILLK
jgi:glycosyltransferase involved in cell wall biosynthesis